MKPGESSTITCNGVSPQSRPLTYSYSASAGSINGTGNTATLSTTGAPAGTITVTGTVQDDKGQTASATTTVNVEAPPPPPTPKTQTLCSIQFDKDKRRPARVDNEAKACLDDVALNAQQKADAALVVVGNSAPVPAPKAQTPRRNAYRRGSGGTACGEHQGLPGYGEGHRRQPYPGEDGHATARTRWRTTWFRQALPSTTTCLARPLSMRAQ